VRDDLAKEEVKGFNSLYMRFGTTGPVHVSLSKNTCWVARGEAFNMTSTGVQRKIQTLWNSNCVYCLFRMEHSRINPLTPEFSFKFMHTLYLKCG
jgi:hypothetical protein